MVDTAGYSVCMCCGCVAGGVVSDALLDNARDCSKKSSRITPIFYSDAKGSTYKALFHWNERIAQLDCRDPPLPRGLLEAINGVLGSKLEILAQESKKNVYIDWGEVLNKTEIENILKEIRGNLYYKHKKVKQVTKKGEKRYSLKKYQYFRPCCLMAKGTHKCKGHCCHARKCRCIPMNKKFTERWIRIRYEMTGLRPPPITPEMRIDLQDLFLKVNLAWQFVRHDKRCDGTDCALPGYKCRHNLGNYGFIFIQLFCHLAEHYPKRWEKAGEFLPYISTLKTRERLDWIKTKWKEMFQWTKIQLYDF